MATAVQHASHDHGHGLDLPTRIARARIGALLLILSDAGFVLGMYVSQTYLRILNMNQAFKIPAETPPAVGVGLILSLVMVVSAAAYVWGWLGLRDGSLSRYRTGVIIAFILALAMFIAQVIVVFSIRYPTPIHGYGSLVIIMSAYHAIHLLVTSLIGFLLLGRITHNRMAGHEYVAEVSGYWWVYVAASALTTWAMLAFIK
jgi:heme/copper-type cytochrome/quinol oxidase subunit 3